MDRDELDDRVRRAAQAEPATIDRVVRAALASDERVIPVRAWPRAFEALSAGLVGAVALSIWWCVRPPATVNDGVFRAEATLPVASDGVYRVEAVPTVAPVGVVRVTTEKGASWIFSTTLDGDWLPRGTALVVGEGGQK